MRQFAKVDDNHDAVRFYFRSSGCSVASTACLGRGVPDLLVAFNEKTCWLEVKDGSKPPSKRRLTSDEQKFHKEWKGKLFVVETLEDCRNVLRWLGVDLDICECSMEIKL